MHHATPRKRFTRHSLALWIAGSASLLAGSPALAQVSAPPQVDAGALQKQELERRRQEALQAQEKEKPQAAVRAAAPVVAAPAEPGSKFLLREVQFGPSAFLSREELAAISSRYTGQQSDFAGLTAMVGDINASYRAHGVLTGRAVLPPQRVVDGVVKVELVEAKVGRIDVTGNRYTRASYVTGWLPDQVGQTLDTRLLEERIQRFNRSGAVQLEANLRPGASYGLTDVVLGLHEPQQGQLRAFVNNEGSESIGREQVGVDTAINGLAGIGDRLAMYLTHSRGANLGSLSYSVPVNRWGGQVSASYSIGATNVIAGPYRELDITGKSRTLQLALVQPVWQQGGWWLDLAASTGKTRSDNLIGGLMLSESTLFNQTVGATFAGASAQRNVSLALAATHAKATAAVGPERHFNVRQLTASWLENVGSRQFAVLRTSMQDTGNVILAPTLLFQLGGSSSVRGYEVGALSGDRGYLANLEFHRTLSNEVTAFVFHDLGQVRTAGLPHQSARSAGVGMNAQWGAIRANLTAGRALTTVTPDQAKWRVTGRLSYDF